MPLTPEGPALAEAAFPCVVHGTRAGFVQLHAAEDGDWVVTVDGAGGGHAARVGAAGRDRITAALAGPDAAALHQVDAELAPFYCPECRAAYCAECWRTWLVFADDLPGWLDEVRGTCPRGHERMLSD